MDAAIYSSPSTRFVRRFTSTIPGTGQADLVVLAQAFLRDLYRALHAARELHEDAPWTPQYGRARD